MVAPEKQNAVASTQFKRKGTIASRYLQAIGMQCGTDGNVGSSRNSYRSTPIAKKGGFEDEYYSFKDNKNNKSVYDQMRGTTAAADCSKSIITASTLLIDHSDSISTTPTSPGGSGHGKSPGRRTPRRGRSPTAIREGTNSRSNSNRIDDSNHEYVHNPGTRTTAPLSDGVKSAPSTPTRFDDRRKLQLRTRSWNGGNNSYIARMNAKSIMAINSESDESDNSSKPDSRLGLTFYKNGNGIEEHPSPMYDAGGIQENPSPLSSESSFFPKTSPRRPSNSPGPQPLFPRQSTYHPITPDYSQRRQSHPSYPTESEAGSPTEIMENIQRGGDEPSSLSEPTDSEAGAPTEITKNHRAHLRRPSGGDRGNDILSRVRNRFHNQHHRPQPHTQKPESDGLKPTIPSLLDANSSCGSSVLPITAAQAEGASASILPPGRLSRHVENARKQSIWSPEPSEVTSVQASDNETFGSTSLTTEIGSAVNNRLGAKPLSSLQSLAKPVVETKAESKPETKVEASTPKQGGLMRKPVNSRVAVLHSHYRKGKFTARGARSNKPEPVEEKQEIVQHKESEDDDFPIEHFESDDFPDPIISASYSYEDIEKHKNTEQIDEEDGGFKDLDQEPGKKANISPDNGVYDFEFEESPLPEYVRHQATKEGADRSSAFVAYNYRQTPNTDGVFQFKKGKPKNAKRKTNAKVDQTRGRNRGKSPIQPLFSSERLDEDNTASVIRSKSLGRTMTSQKLTKIADRNTSGFEDIKGLPRRSKSLSERSERKFSSAKKHMTSMELSEAMKTIARDRKRREEDKAKQQATSDSVPSNIVVNNEQSKAGGCVEARGSTSTLTQSTISSPQSKPAKGASISGARNTDTQAKEEASQKELTSSIKDKIRAFNLKKSPTSYGSNKKSPYSTGNSSSRWRNASARTDEEKKEDGYDAERFNAATSPNAKPNKLDRKSLWSRYYAESLKNRDDNESNSSNDDDFSVQSLKEQLEQKISKNEFAGGDEDDDDRSVRSLRDMFEPAKKPSGEAVNNLKARFEPKPKAPRLAFTKQARLQRSRSKRIEESNKGVSAGEAGATQENSASYEWWKLQQNDSPEGQDSQDLQTELMRKNAQVQSNARSTGYQAETKSIRMDPAGQRWNSNASNLNQGETVTREAKTHRANTGMSQGNKRVSLQHQVYGYIESHQAPLKDNNRKVPGSHWVSQGSTDSERIIQTKGTKESSSGSEYSEAVTLDPSFAEVSNLSNPSALQSPETEEDDSNSSVLFENLDHNTSYGELGNSNSQLAIPELKEPRREVNSPRVVSGSSIRKYRDLNSPSRGNAKTERIQTEIKEEFPRIVTPDNGHTSETKADFSERNEHVGVTEGDYGASASYNDIIYGAQRDVNDHGRPDRNAASFGYSGQTNDFGYQSSEASNPTMGNYHQSANSSDRSGRSSEVPSTHRSDRSLDNAHQDNSYHGSNYFDHSGRSSEVPSSYRSDRSIHNAHQDNSYRGSNHSDRSGRSSEISASYRFGMSLDNAHQEHSYRNSNSSDRSSRSSEAPSSYRSSRSLENPNQDYDAPNRSRGLQESPKEIIRSMVIPHRNRAPSNQSSQSSSTHRSGASDNLSFGKYGPSWDENSNTHKNNHLPATSLPSSKPPVVPPVPSPFDEDYAAIMESRHKMLVVRQRALLTRRANREKAQRTQQGFFGRTNPGNNNDSTSLLNRTNRDPIPSDEFKVATKSPGNRKASNPNSGWESPEKTPRQERHQLRSSNRDSDAVQRAKDILNETGVPRSPVASMFSRIRPSFNAFSRRDNGTSQKQAVIDRISAVRAARLRRNYAYGKVMENSSNNKRYGESGVGNGLPRKLETINDSVSHDIPGYRYYPHSESDDFRVRDGDESLSTKDSNPQEYAAQLSVD